MNDSRLVTAKEELHTALIEMETDEPNIARVRSLLDDARTGIVEVVDGGLSSGCSKADLNQLDSARLFINRAASLLSKEWAFDQAETCVGHAVDYLQVVLSGNVIPLRAKRTSTTPGGGAA